MKKPTETVQLKLRFSERLRARLEKAAANNDDSMNSEIIRRLEQSFSRDDILTEIHNSLADLKRAMAEMQEQQFEKFRQQMLEEMQADEDQRFADSQEDYWREGQK
jgi:hypothetical protein